MKPRRQLIVGFRNGIDTPSAFAHCMRDVEDPDFSDLSTARPEHSGERLDHYRKDYLAA